MGIKARGYCKARAPASQHDIPVLTTCDNDILVSNYRICGDDTGECACGGSFISCMITNMSKTYTSWNIIQNSTVSHE